MAHAHRLAADGWLGGGKSKISKTTPCTVAKPLAEYSFSELIWRVGQNGGLDVITAQHVGRIMYRIALLCTFALTASPTLAGEKAKDQEADRLMQVLRDEIAREDCLWRESLVRLSDQTTSDEQQKIVGLVAYFCSQKNRERIVQGATTEDFGRHEVAAYDQLWAQERAIAIDRQIRNLREREFP